MSELAILFSWALALTNYEGVMPRVVYIDEIPGCLPCEAIFMDDTVYLTNKRPSIAVHEFVHSLQPKDMGCMDSEIEAYKVQNQYMYLNGIMGHEVANLETCAWVMGEFEYITSLERYRTDI